MHLQTGQNIMRSKQH